jgi:hypothetical protein
MVRVIALFATQNHRACKPGMAEFAVGSFPARNWHEPSLSQIGDQLVDFPRHEAPGVERQLEIEVALTRK